ncbi:MAG: hypothetical protein GXP59_00275 [Deltaproteobacteria bacterium]|nr:hypothetical protein [Deltaproteobacteria bacterium]
MRDWQKITLGLALLVVTAWPTGNARGSEISGRASTEVDWFDTAHESTAVPVFQYLQLQGRNLGGKGYDFHLYGRVGDDLAGKQNSYATSRLYYAYINRKNFLTNNLDMRLGRQFIVTTAGASLMDGLRLSYKLHDDYRLTMFGGGDVAYYEGYNSGDAVAGGQISGRWFDALDIGLSSLTKWRDGALSKELFGLNFDYDWNNTIFLQNETQYDYLSKRISYFTLSARQHLSPSWTVNVGYLYSLPVFSATSIFSVFAVDEYQEVNGEVTYNFNKGWRAFGRYTREIYQEFSDANVLEAGLEKIRTDQYSGYISGVYRNEADGQDMRGFKARIARMFANKIQAGLGVEVDVLQRRINYFDIGASSSDTTSKRFWADVTLFITPKMTLQAKLERSESELWNYYNRGLLRLNTSF